MQTVDDQVIVFQGDRNHPRGYGYDTNASAAWSSGADEYDTVYGYGYGDRHQDNYQHQNVVYNSNDQHHHYAQQPEYQY